MPLEDHNTKSHLVHVAIIIVLALRFLCRFATWSIRLLIVKICQVKGYFDASVNKNVGFTLNFIYFTTITHGYKEATR